MLPFCAEMTVSPRATQVLAERAAGNKNAGEKERARMEALMKEAMMAAWRWSHSGAALYI